MRQRLAFCGLAIITLASGQALAVDIVSDPLVESSTLQSLAKEVEAIAQRAEQINHLLSLVLNAEHTLAAVSHGNLSALGALSSELGALGVTSPLGTDGSALLSALGRTAGDLSQTAMLGQVIVADGQIFASSGGDYRALNLNSVAQVLASQRQIATNSLNSTTAYQQKLLALRQSLGNTADVKAAADAGARLQGETASQVANGNQMLALIYQQGTQARLTDAQQDQAWRCWAEQMQQQASGASFNGGACQSGSTSGTTTSGTLTANSAGSAFSDGSGTTTSVAPSGGSAALDTMLATSWGQTAADNATQIGISPDALAATCVMESGCRTNVGGTGTISGVMQMSNGAFQEGLQTASATGFDTSQLSGGKNDAVAQSAAAAGYLLQDANYLQKAGVDPTLLNTRAAYQFGQANGASIGQAASNDLMVNTVTGLSAKTLAANGITGSTTVGQWQQTIINKVGATTANASVLTGGST